MLKLTTGLTLGLAFLLVVGSSAEAAPGDAPKIKVRDVKKNSIVLSVKDKEYKKDKAKIKVSYREKGKKGWTKVSFKKKFDKKGKAKIAITGLDKNTKYEIKAKGKEAKKSKYSKSSGKKKFKTAK